MWAPSWCSIASRTPFVSPAIRISPQPVPPVGIAVKTVIVVSGYALDAVPTHVSSGEVIESRAPVIG